MEYSSKIIEQAVEIFGQFPGVGKKTALRYVLHIIRQDQQKADQLSRIIDRLKSDLKYCTQCHTISEQEVCDVCSNMSRDRQLICVVQDYRDILAIENTGLYKGLYHVLGGLISPMEGISPSSLNIDSLVQRINNGENMEIILALNATMEGDTTNFYIYKQIKNTDVISSSIARGISVGDELEYADEVTLGRSITNRIPFDHLLKK